jgi:hypothetical protein
MRAAHLEAAAAAGFERSSVAGATKWGARWATKPGGRKLRVAKQTKSDDLGIN